MTWRLGTATIAALSLAILPLSMAPANADDTAPSTPTPSAPAATVSSEPVSSAEPAPSAETDPAAGESVAARTIIVTFDKAQADPAQAAEAAVAKVADQVADAQVSKVDPITDSMVAVTLDGPLSTAESASIEDRVSDAKGVTAAETAGRFHPMTTNDTYYNRLWNLNSAGTYGVHAEDAWPTSTGANAIVAVIDTGITAHSDLTGSAARIIGGNIVEGYDFISDRATAGDGGGRDSNPSDTGDFDGFDYSSWHGTHVAGIVAALANNAAGVVGVAPNAKVSPLRVLGRGGGDEQDVIAAIYWGAGIDVSDVPANPQPADVLNLSLGTNGPCGTAMQTAIDAATAKGVVVVAAAGNAGVPVSQMSPANCDNVISVGATTQLGTLADYSNYGAAGDLTISAPGGGTVDPAEGSILSTYNRGDTTVSSATYGWMSGTSMATPHVAATVALLKSLDPTLDLAEVRSLLTDTARAVPYCTECGAGLMDSAAAVAALASSLGDTPAAEPLQTAAPKVSGVTRVGQTLTALPTADPSASLSYQWYRNGATIVGATGQSYLVTSSDKDRYLLVKVTASVAGHKTIRFSTETAKIGSGILAKLASPKASGTFKVGRTVSASKGTWSPTPSSFSYRWLRSGKSISGATKSKYKLTSKDRGKRISVRVTVKKSAYSTTSATSSKYTVKR